MKNIKLFLSVFLLVVAFTASNVLALPHLQVGIDTSLITDASNAFYDTSDESWFIISESGEFTVTAFARGTGSAFDSNNTTRTAYLVAALIPNQGSTADFGTLTIDGVSYSSWDTVGTPPNLGGLTKEEYKDYTGVNVTLVPKHGVYETAYIEHEFVFDGTQDENTWNFQDGNPDTGPYTDGYLENFVVNLTGMNFELIDGVHFDLYTKDDDDGGVYKFAPFSHDASAYPVPEPATMLLLGTGLIGMAGIGRKKFKK